MNRFVKIALFSDIHYALTPNYACPGRKGEYALDLLELLIERINGEIKPDLVLCAGDLINFPDAPEAKELTSRLAELFRRLSMPYAAIRGNHDLPQHEFTRFFPFKKIIDSGFVRIVCFDDQETPGYNAVRSGKDRQFLIDAAKNWNGVLFSLQHTPLTEPGSCIFGYDNSAELLQLLRENGYRGTISGHFHDGIPLCERQNLQFIVQSALCESPFTGTLLTVSDSGIIAAEPIATNWSGQKKDCSVPDKGW